MAQGIHLRDMLRLMAARDEEGRPVPFSLEAYTYNRRDKLGGNRTEYHGCVLLTEDAVGTKPMSKQKRERRAKAQDRRRRPDLYGKAIRQIMEPHGQVRRVHIYLITKFNGQPVHA